jgi:hypothetical protein
MANSGDSISEWVASNHRKWPKPTKRMATMHVTLDDGGTQRLPNYLVSDPKDFKSYRKLIKYLDYSATGSGGETILYTMCDAEPCGERTQLVNELLMTPEGLDSVNVTTDSGDFPLSAAILWGQIEVVRLLVAAGALLKPEGDNVVTGPYMVASGEDYGLTAADGATLQTVVDYQLQNAMDYETNQDRVYTQFPSLG